MLYVIECMDVENVFCMQSGQIFACNRRQIFERKCSEFALMSFKVSLLLS